jgi:hypothetical protein
MTVLTVATYDHVTCPDTRWTSPAPSSALTTDEMITDGRKYLK